MKRLMTCLICLLLVLGLFPTAVLAAPEWPSDTSIEADGGIVIDANTSTVLYGKNIHERYYPASITKVLTALITLERCKLNEQVTFSHDAVYNVEEGSSNANIEEGDVLTVEDCLYALLLNSANEAGNALAEHISGSREAFAELMNERAAELGCQDSHFANPSGLNDENHYTSAYDMALICQAAIKNETFRKIDGALYYDLRPTKRDPEGHTLYAHHAMMKKNDSRYYPGIFGGKTGYTSLAGNTLVTFAERDGMTLIAVILNGHLTHYSDTKALLNFGFNNFQNLNISDNDTTYSSVENDMTIAGLPSGDLSKIILERGSSITLPKDADFSDAEVTLEYELDEGAPENAIAKILYSYNDRAIGSAYLLNETVQPISLPALPPDEGTSTASSEAASTLSAESSNDAAPSASSETLEPGKDKKDGKGFHIPVLIWIILAAAAAAAVIMLIILVLRVRHIQKERERKLRRAKRLRRLKEIGVSSDEFDNIMASRRSPSDGQSDDDDQ
ncbi:D-alanyl-D-alanine carboxypeptidase family protein [Clostridium sp. AM58-1XD]|uniref:D-alanyl-D-alanine carboxypeptidase family protein n=1 Tax=Clostridium sp. AM58-1XD TaxID=2292307 RepID=UPI000E51C288|nr:D-alanyl-D-alanine carboxypeptidase family protein [Clostridium sp. AM58-1XD]RGY97385.1 D-alanyl-D-alanine carboxypeptidase [Clostridium sp. AM58-1XD]